MRKKGRTIYNTTLNKSLVICVPYLNSIGGTEVEALMTAVGVYDKNIFNKITLFSPTKINISLFKNMVGERKIAFLTYPIFFSNQFMNLINRLFFKLGFKFKVFEFLFWKYHGLKFSTFFILTSTKSTYFFSIIKSISVNKKVIGKITMGLFTPLLKSYLEFYERFNKIIVFNDKQKEFWDKSYNFKQIVTLDIMIPNESNLLNMPLRRNMDEKNLVFGFLGRVSSEKNIMDMIFLIDFLNNKNNLYCKLIIQGEGDAIYLGELHKKVVTLKLSNFVFFNSWFVDPLLNREFYEKIDVFLVTSFWEGGPITSLEAAAAGRLILGYDVGAMDDRFKLFPFMINKNFNELCYSALEIVKMDSRERSKFISKIRSHYSQNLNNNKKEESFLEIIGN